MKGSLRKQIIVAVLVSQLLLAIGLTVAIVLYSRAQLLSDFNIMLEGRVDTVLADAVSTSDCQEIRTLPWASASWIEFNSSA